MSAPNPGAKPWEWALQLLREAPDGMTPEEIAEAQWRTVAGARLVLAGLAWRGLARPTPSGRWQLTQHASELVGDQR